MLGWSADDMVLDVVYVWVLVVVLREETEHEGRDF